MVPAWRPERFHSVSPWRTSHSLEEIAERWPFPELEDDFAAGTASVERVCTQEISGAIPFSGDCASHAHSDEAIRGRESLIQSWRSRWSDAISSTMSSRRNRT